jgi:hypothetical protein
VSNEYDDNPKQEQQQQQNNPTTPVDIFFRINELIKAAPKLTDEQKERFTTVMMQCSRNNPQLFSRLFEKYWPNDRSHIEGVMKELKDRLAELEEE